MKEKHRIHLIETFHAISDTFEQDAEALTGAEKKQALSLSWAFCVAARALSEVHNKEIFEICDMVRKQSDMVEQALMG